MSKQRKQLAHQAAPPPQNQQQKQPSQMVEVGYAGPIPPPSQLNAFNTIIPDGAHRIMLMAEKAQDAQIARSSAILNARKDVSKREHIEVMTGQILSFVLCLSSLFCGALLLWKGLHWQGVLLSGVPLSTIVVALITRGKRRK